MLDMLASYLQPDDTVERCGLVLADGSIIEVENTHPNPTEGFKISARDLMRDPVASWHTHPGASANLSQEDYRGFLQWPHLDHYIIGINGVRKYRIVDGVIIQCE